MQPYKQLHLKHTNKKSVAQQARHAASKAAIATDKKLLFRGLDVGRLQARLAQEKHNKMINNPLPAFDRLGKVNRRHGVVDAAVYRKRRNEYRVCKPEEKVVWYNMELNGLDAYEKGFASRGGNNNRR